MVVEAEGEQLHAQHRARGRNLAGDYITRPFAKQGLGIDGPAARNRAGRRPEARRGEAGLAWAWFAAGRTDCGFPAQTASGGKTLRPGSGLCAPLMAE